MMDPIDPDIVLGFVEEACGYLPKIEQALADIEDGNNTEEAVAEAHRLVHIIKGASAMLGITELRDIVADALLYLEKAESENETLEPSLILQVRDAIKGVKDFLTRFKEDNENFESGDDWVVEESTAVSAPELDAPDLGAPDFDVPDLGAPDFDVPDFDVPDFGAPDLDALGPPMQEMSSPDLDALLSSVAEISAPDLDAPDLDALGLSISENEILAESSDEEELDVMDSLPPGIFEIYAEEANDHLTTLATLLGELLVDSKQQDLWDEVRRRMHTMKGAAGSVGFEVVMGLAHQAEDLLDLICEGKYTPTHDSVNLLASLTDILEDLTNDPRNDSAREAAVDFSEAFKDIIYTDAEPSKEIEDEVQAQEEIKPVQPAAVEPISQPVAAEPISQPVAVEPTSQPTASSAQTQGPTIRVPLEELDALVRMVGEVVVNRSAFQQFFGDLIRQSKDLQLGTLRLRGIAERLENDYEVAALTSTAASAAAAGGGNDNGMLRSVSGEGGAGFDELEFDRYTEFHLLTRELGEAISDLDAIGIEASATIGDFDGAMNRLGRLSGDLEGKLMHVRLVPLASISTRLGRIVRVTAGKLGRRASFALEGGEIGLDKGVLEDILEPLGHLIRNAVDHGLEAPEERLRLGKDPMGSVRISASHEGTQVVIRVSDDGAGIDHDRLRKKAVERDFLSAEDAEKASNDEMRNILFLPGFSTASQLTNISGRGVGLDVVKERVLAMKGSVTIASVAGEGTTFTIRLPMTLAVSRALLVGAAGAKWALPFAYLHEILRVEQGELTVIGEHPVFNYAGRVIRTIFLDQALGYHNDDSRERRAEQPILLIKVADEEIALVVDKIFGGQKIAIKNLGNHLLSVPGVSGATLMGDGSVVLILKPEDLSARAEVSDLVVTRAGIDAASAGRRMEILVVDDSLSVRRVVSQALRGAGWTPVLARDGVEALEALSKSSKTPDLVLLDIEMPRMDGFELSAALQADPRYKNIPIVMLTSRSGKKHRDRGMELGVKEYLVKPYKEEVLLDIVRRLTSAPQDKTTAHLSGA